MKDGRMNLCDEYFVLSFSGYIWSSLTVLEGFELSFKYVIFPPAGIVEKTSHSVRF